MAKAVGLSQSAIARMWRAFAPQPHDGDDLRAVDEAVDEGNGTPGVREDGPPVGEVG